MQDMFEGIADWKQLTPMRLKVRANNTLCCMRDNVEVVFDSF